MYAAVTEYADLLNLRAFPSGSPKPSQQIVGHIIGRFATQGRGSAGQGQKNSVRIPRPCSNQLFATLLLADTENRPWLPLTNCVAILPCPLPA